MSELQQMRLTLQESMTFLGAVAAGIEETVGQTANGITYVAGKALGKKFSAGARKTEDVEKALAEVRRVLEENQCLWRFEPFRPQGSRTLVERTPDGEKIMLVFRDCMIRQSLFMFGHPQKGSLCTMMFGFFAGALESIMGRQSNLEIVHAGQNACYKCLTIQSAPAQPGAKPKRGKARAK